MEKEFASGDYLSIIDHAAEIEAENSFMDLFYLARSYTKLNLQRKSIKTINRIKKFNEPCEKVAYHSLLSYYYQIMLYKDSCAYHADIAMKTLYNSQCQDSLLISETYRQYANAMRNGEGYHSVLDRSPKLRRRFKYRNRFLKKYLDTAMFYAPNAEQKGNVYHTMGTMLSDAVYQYSITGHPEFKHYSKEAIEYLNKCIALETSTFLDANAYAIIGLIQYYIEEYEDAEQSFLQGIEYTKVDEKVKFAHRFIVISDWLGMTYETVYRHTQNKEYLHKANEIYKASVKTWDLNIGKTLYNDAYHNSAKGKLIKNNLDLFEVSHDSTYLYEAFDYLERSKYPEFYNEQVSINEIQNRLSNHQAFVSYGSVNRPWRNIAFIITQNDFEVVVSKGELMMNSIAEFHKLYRFNDFQDFKKRSNEYYKVYFEMVDTLLTQKGIDKVIVSNSDNMSLLNLDVLVADTLGEKWKDLNYVFHRYKFSYALSAGAFLNQEKTGKAPNSFGISLGHYKEEANLRFSKRLTENFNELYGATNIPIDENILKKDISLLLSHGEGGYNQSSAVVKLNGVKSVSTKDVEEMKLENELVVFSACNTNASQRYFSSGAIGSFAKAFRKAGSKAVITTSWAIDDQSNAFILERFIDHLAKGISKDEALWQAQKEYWNQCSSDEEYNPLYWAPYVLTGNSEGLVLEKETHKFYFSVYWYLLLFPIPLFILLKRRFS